ncbi:MAG TPA: DinB family protein [Flavisolibacter sp.]|jgi:hypothetical protein
MTDLTALINRLESHIPHNEVADPNVSRGAVGWHIAHTLLTINVVADALVSSRPEEYRWKFDWRRSFFLAIGKIPRGKIRAPEVVQVKQELDKAALSAQVAATREKVKALPDLQPRNFFTHPFLGKIKLKPAIKFLCIHTQHHLKIIEDLVQAAKSK